MGISIISAVIALLSFGYPILTTSNRNSDQAKEFVAALASPDRQTFLTAMSHVQQDTSAETYLRNVDDWWAAAFRASGVRTWADYKPDGGSYRTEGDGYMVCLPELVQLTTRCLPFTRGSSTILRQDLSADSRLRRSPSTCSRRGSFPTSTGSATRADLKVFARAYGRMVSPDQSTVCVSFYLSVEADESVRRSTSSASRFALEDQNEQPAEGKVYWPSKLNYLEHTDVVACLPAPGGYVEIVQQKSKSKRALKSTGWLSVH